MQCDYLIVGGGTAGCILAERLSADGQARVMLVEAGRKPRNPLVGIPAAFAKLFKSGSDWNYSTAPQRAAGDRMIYVPRGKMLGGSANMNALIHQSGHPADFEGWVSSGAEGWGWRDVRPVFQKLHDELAFETNPHAHPAALAFVNSARRTLAHSGQRVHGDGPEGAWIADIATRRGRRRSVYDTHLKPATRRANLRVVTGALVDRILFKEGRAVGARVTINGQDEDILAHASVILSAGAIGSPAILMRSGIGHEHTLRSFGIDTRFHSPEVGRNLQDHPMVVPTFATSHANTYKSAESLPNLLNYLFRKKGPLASNAAEAIAFARSSAGLRAADIELIFAPLEWRKEALQPPAIHAFSIGVAVVAPASRGSVTLSGRDAEKPPVIVAGIRLARKIAVTEPLASQLVGEHAPGMTTQSDEDLRRWLRTEVQTVYHPSCTCRMGAAGQSVVSPRLAVHGVDRLWVADASVMPSVVRGHPNTAVTMIAARGAEFVRAA
jgi:choline dehydrogenase